MFNTNLQTAPRIDGPNRAFIWMDSPEYEISILENDPLDSVAYHTIFISSSASAFPGDPYGEGESNTVYLGASAGVISFGQIGEGAIAEVIPSELDNSFVSNVFPIFKSNTTVNTTKLYRNVPNEEFSFTDKYITGAIKATVVNRDPARLGGTWVEYGPTQYGLVNVFNAFDSNVIETEFRGTTATVINNSTDAPENNKVTSSLLTLRNLAVTVNPHQFLEIKLEVGSQISSVEQLPPGLILDNTKRIIGVIQYSGTYDILIKLASGDELDAKIICLPLTRLA